MRNENKSNIIEEIDRHKEKWTQLSLQIHDHPELSFQEYQAMEWLTEPLFEEGFRVQKA
ncbi:hypothetical protein [Salibacterium aidingense]|uniref:hypothetical protein n=1 Tax=Salibacterium aidingense TaxID=384933 RepID=UPI0004229E36|nr:hypothetical protein [Salibacterium aidingense]